MKETADDVFFVDTEELIEESLGTGYTPNQAGQWEGFEEPPPLEEIYGGFSRFLVRTALVRSKEWSMRKAPKITSPESAMRLVQHLLYADQEHIVLLCLNAKPQLVAIHETAIGTTDRASVVARDLVKVPLLVGAPAVILCHNHPSGAPQFSPEDIKLTKTVQKAFACVGVTLLDHILVARPALSFMNESLRFSAEARDPSGVAALLRRVAQAVEEDARLPPQIEVVVVVQEPVTDPLEEVRRTFSAEAAFMSKGTADALGLQGQPFEVKLEPEEE